MFKEYKLYFTSNCLRNVFAQLEIMEEINGDKDYEPSVASIV